MVKTGKEIMPLSTKPTRIQKEKRQAILDGALDVFSSNGFRGSTIDQIAKQVAMSKPNLLYYFHSKEAIHEALIDGLLDTWLAPLQTLGNGDEPLEDIIAYVQHKLQAARDYPRESRLFANEIVQGAPRIGGFLAGPLKQLVEDRCVLIKGWMDEGKLALCDPYHLIFSIWATTQHYADFEIQVLSVAGSDDGADAFLEKMYRALLTP